MTKMIFINLPVTDLPRAKSFYEAIGFTNNPHFTDDTAACMVLSDAIHVMLLTHDKFKQFTPLAIGDPRKTSQVLISVSMDSRTAVDTIVEQAKGAGGAIDPSPVDDHGFMYGRGFEDPDGHLWGVMWMDADAIANGPPDMSKA